MVLYLINKESVVLCKYMIDLLFTIILMSQYVKQLVIIIHFINICKLDN